MPIDYPLQLSPYLARRVWGGMRLGPGFGGTTTPSPSGGAPPSAAAAHDGPIGEAWTISDHPDGVSTVANGPLAGRTLAELIADHGQEMTGRRLRGRYPLLVKFVDAAEDLSLQVHPDDAAAARLATGDRGKTECWYVVGCKKGTRVIHGVREGTDAPALRGAIERGDVSEVVRHHDLEPDMFLYVPAGTIHAILGGTFVCEIQQSSNTTFRLFDWNRQPPRPLHLEEALAVADFRAPHPDWIRRVRLMPGFGPRSTPLVTNEFFDVDLLTLAPESGVDVGASAPAEARGPRETLFVVVGGAGALHYDGGAIPLRVGTSIFLPAVAGGVALDTGEGVGLKLLVAHSHEE